MIFAANDAEPRVARGMSQGVAEAEATAAAAAAATFANKLYFDGLIISISECISTPLVFALVCFFIHLIRFSSAALTLEGKFYE